MLFKTDLPRLVGVTATDDPAVETFAKNTALACFEDGIIYDIVSVKQDEVEDTVHELNNNDISPKVSGVIVHYPIFKSQPGLDDRLRHLVSPKLDVEGLHHSKNNNNRSTTTTTTDHYSVLHSPFSMFPCTALSVLKILQSFPDVYFPNRTITIFNRSDIFGRPLANILAQHGAKIYSIDKHDILCYQQSNIAQCSNSTTNKDCVQQSSIIITAVPSNTFRIPSSWIQPNSIVINVSFFDNVDQESIYNVPNINYVPCIGKVTIAVLEHNLIKLHSKYHSNIPFKVSS